MSQPLNKPTTTGPAPTITIVLHARPAGPTGEYYFESQVSITHMPGGWRMAHHGLCLALEKIVPEMEKQAKEEGLVKLAHQLPNGNGLLT